MYIRFAKSKYNKEEFVYLVESYRDEKKKPKQRVIQSLGTVSDLTKDNPNAIAELKAWAKDLSNRQQEERYVSLLVDMNESMTNEQIPINYGYVFLEAIYNELHISEFMNNYQAKTNVSYSIDDILKLLVFSRSLNPASKKRTYEQKGNYFFELPDFSLDDVYRSLTHLSTMKDELTLHIHNRIQETKGRDCSLIFYDVTNYYFESESLKGLRQKGVSKENRETGIVQMGLFIDREGIPITYELFPGNTNDLATMKPILEKIKKEYNLGKITIVADKGNNSGENLAYIDNEEDLYIISQRIRARGTELANIVLDQEDYEWNSDNTFKSKTVERERLVKRPDGSTYSITEHLLCFWSKNEESYQRNKRGFLDEKIEKFINNPSLLNASNSFGVKKYFKKMMIDKITGEVLKTKPTYVFNQEKYERDLALDGYYCIVTNDLSLEPLDIIHHYHQLSKIEESFKVTKTDLEGRPIYVWTDEHIKGHFLTCYLALTLYRLLQLKLDKAYPIHQLKEALNSANIMKLNKDIYLLQSTTSLFNQIRETYRLDLGYKTMKVEKIRRELAKAIK
ncbi:IS1634 family transposase [Peloplasma aerotolerans]|uniref:IS1634 family transposase n=1 Tax=Peloplasma aerotolerans TaxID=3044389 RepID=A0AAW6UDU0_9MOLU|nr:IS1634 family transposase [Mariniplasma sp. M4Ah]MDI6453804.1 IS1634 family transposase [Mariniplasma sp. M4Ah]MDR4968839.1 IS1634 family transposase [Acholeplasmataceae bacterium]